LGEWQRTLACSELFLIQFQGSVGGEVSKWRENAKHRGAEVAEKGEGQIPVNHHGTEDMVEFFLLSS